MNKSGRLLDHFSLVRNETSANFMLWFRLENGWIIHRRFWRIISPVEFNIGIWLDWCLWKSLVFVGVSIDWRICQWQLYIEHWSNFIFAHHSSFTVFFMLVHFTWLYGIVTVGTDKTKMPAHSRLMKHLKLFSFFTNRKIQTT